MSQENYLQLFINYLSTNKGYLEALKIVQKNSKPGGIWLIGGQVFRPLLKIFHNIDFEEVYDFDFLIENPLPFDEIILPRGWELTKTSLGAPRFKNSKKQIDFIPLDDAINHYKNISPSRMSNSEKIDSYITRTPLNIQMIVYDALNKNLYGEKGLKAIQDKIIKINCEKECLNFCKKRKISVRNFLDNKVKGDMFERIYPTFENNHKVSTIKYYDNNIQKYLSKEGFNQFPYKYLSKEIEIFLTNLPGKKILDIGAGNGRDSTIFKSKGFKPIAIDISQSMVEECNRNQIEAYIQDIEDCSLENNSFDGAFAYCSLLHIPKDRIYNSIARIYELLKPDGIFFIGMIKGSEEVVFDERFFALYSEEELKNILEEYFEIIHQRTFKSRSQDYINFICKRK